MGNVLLFVHLDGGKKPAPLCSPGLITPRVLMIRHLLIEYVSGRMCQGFGRA